jgi:hypothetical protein
MRTTIPEAAIRARTSKAARSSKRSRPRVTVLVITRFGSERAAITAA